MSDDRRRACEVAWVEGLEGRFRSMEQVVWKLSGDSAPESRAWQHALRALRWHAEPAMGALPAPDVLGALARASDEARHAAMLAAAQAVKAAALRMDAAAIAHYRPIFDACAGGAIGEAHAWCDAARAWILLAAGEHERAEQRATEACAHAREASAPAALIDASALLALAVAPRDLGSALDTARRASRMARTEGLPQGEYLANVVLARIRRLTGRPHHAARILAALARVAPLPWQPFIVAELALAGALDSARAAMLGAEDAIGPVAARPLLDAFFAARDGDRETFDARAAAATGGLGTLEPFAAELADTLCAIDPARPANATDAEIRGWLTGVDTATPARLLGLSAIVEAESADEGTAAFVVARPGGAARRVVALGHALAAVDLRIEPKRGRPGRVETMIAALALAPQGLQTGALFRTIYGFEYEAARHRDLFKQLVYRARGELGDAGTIERDDERFRLELRGSILVPDPRCERPLEDLVLRFLARHGAGSAKATASTLKISLRKAQQALAQLADEGAIEVDKDGRAVHYRLEDTTFSEPTRV